MKIDKFTHEVRCRPPVLHNLRKDGGMKNREGRGAVCQRHAHIHVPVWVNNSWRGCAELKVCHCVWGAAVEGDVAFIFDGEVDGVGFIKSRRGRRGALGGW